MSVAWSDLWAALALMLVLEGLMPFLSPAKLRETLPVSSNWMIEPCARSA